MSKDLILQKSNDKCPLCQTGYLYPTLVSGITGLISSTIKFRCNNCNGLILKIFDEITEEKENG